MFVCGCPCLRAGIDLTTGLKAIPGNSPPRPRSRRCTRLCLPDRCPGGGSLVLIGWFGVLESPVLAGGGANGGDLAADGPDEAGEFAGDRGDGDGLELSSPGQRPVARAQPALRLPGDVADSLRRRRDLGLFVFAHPRRMLIAPGALHQDAAGAAVAGLGDRAALDGVAGRNLPPAPGRDRPSTRAAFESATDRRSRPERPWPKPGRCRASPGNVRSFV